MSALEDRRYWAERVGEVVAEIDKWTSQSPREWNSRCNLTFNHVYAVRAALAAVGSHAVKLREVVDAFRYAVGWLASDSWDLSSEAKEKLVAAETMPLAELGSLSADELARIGQKLTASVAPEFIGAVIRNAGGTWAKPEFLHGNRAQIGPRILPPGRKREVGPVAERPSGTTTPPSQAREAAIEAARDLMRYAKIENAASDRVFVSKERAYTLNRALETIASSPPAQAAELELDDILNDPPEPSEALLNLMRKPAPWETPTSRPVHNQIPVQVWADVDDVIADFVRHLNTIPGVRTHACCQGTLGEGGAFPHPAYVAVSWHTDEAREALREFNLEVEGETHGTVHPSPGTLARYTAAAERGKVEAGDLERAAEVLGNGEHECGACGGVYPPPEGCGAARNAADYGQPIPCRPRFHEDVVNRVAAAFAEARRAGESAGWDAAVKALRDGDLHEAALGNLLGYFAVEQLSGGAARSILRRTADFLAANKPETRK